MGRTERVNDVIKTHDPQLFCKRSADGKLCIFREHWKWDSYEVDGNAYHFVRPNHFFIMALTADWRYQSKPVDWGLLPIAEKLKAIDMWNRDLAGEIISNEERLSEERSRDRMRQNEAFLREMRPQFARATNDVNTASLDKKDFRRTYEKRIKE